MPQAGIADDDYEAGILARVEGAEAVEVVTAAETGTAIAGDAAIDDELTAGELSEGSREAQAEAEADLAEEREDPDRAEIEDENLPDELLDDAASALVVISGSCPVYLVTVNTFCTLI